MRIFVPGDGDGDGEKKHDYTVFFTGAGYVSPLVPEFLVQKYSIKKFEFFNCTSSLSLRPKIHDILNFNFFFETSKVLRGGAKQI